MAISVAKYDKPDIDSLAWHHGEAIACTDGAQYYAGTRKTVTAPDCLNIKSMKIASTNTADYHAEVLINQATTTSGSTAVTYDQKEKILVRGATDGYGVEDSWDFNPPLCAESAVQVRVRNTTSTANMYVNLEGWQSPKR